MIGATRFFLSHVVRLLRYMSWGKGENTFLLLIQMDFIRWFVECSIGWQLALVMMKHLLLSYTVIHKTDSCSN